MIKLNYKQLRSPEFSEGFKRMCSFNFNRMKTNLKLARLYKSIIAEATIESELYKKLIDTHCAKDEAGKWKPYVDPTTKKPQPNSFVIDEANQEAYKAAWLEYLDIEVDIDTDKIKARHIEQINPSALELTALEPIVELDIN